MFLAVSKEGYTDYDLTIESMWDVTRTTTLSRLLYASPAWWGYVDTGHKDRLHNFLLKLQRLGFLPRNASSYAEMCDAADDKLFASVLCNKNHVLAQLLPPIKETPYQLHPRAHNRSIPIADSLMRKNFIKRMLYKYSYWSFLIIITRPIQWIWNRWNWTEFCWSGLSFMHVIN